MDAPMKALVGSTIESISISPKHDYVVFSTDRGKKAFYCDGDCCSESWFEHATNIEVLIGSVVTAVEETGTWDIDPPTRQESEYAFSVKITTDKGICELEFRNSSNGYYGGSVHSIEHDDIRRLDVLVEDF